MRFGVVILGVVVVAGILCSCSPARFIDPKLVTPEITDRQFDPIISDEPTIVERVTEKFVFLRASGELNLAIVLHLHDPFSQPVVEVLKSLVRNLQFSDLAEDKKYLDSLTQIRFNVLIDKESSLQDAAKGWVSYSPALGNGVAFRSLLTSKLASAQEALARSSHEPFSWSPYASLERVAQSAPIDTSNGVSALKMIYVRDRDVFDEEGQKESRTSLLSTLRKHPWGEAFSSLAVLSFNASSSRACKPVFEDLGLKPINDDLGINLFKGFEGIASEQEELCNFFPSDRRTVSEQRLASMKKMLRGYTRSQGKIILARSPKNILKVLVNKQPVDAKEFLHISSTNEIQLSTKSGARSGDSIEVIYEPAQ